LKKYFFFIFLVAAVALFFLVKEVFPKSAGRYPFFILLFLLDAYLFRSWKKHLDRWRPFFKYLWYGLFWLPFAVLVVSPFLAAISPVRDWPNDLRTYLFGFVFVLYASKMIPAVFLLFADIIRFVRLLFRYLFTGKVNQAGLRFKRSRWLTVPGNALGLALLILLLQGMVTGPFNFKVRKTELTIPELPTAFDGLKIVQFSDLHLGSWAFDKPLQRMVDEINALQPDLVFFTGDLVNFSTREAYPFEGILRGIHARYGVFSILGNHDYGDYSSWSSAVEKKQNMEDMYALHKRLGWKLLCNSNYILEKDSSRIAILGLENWGSHMRFQKLGKIQTAITGSETIPTRLLLSHDPSFWQYRLSSYSYQIAVTFSGHTHGFQFGMENKRFRWSPSQYLYACWAGLYEQVNAKTWHIQYLYVNRGTGFLGYPGRVGIMPEITLITLKSH
jgi:predicted MPP superfamily phosphohydrolase